MDSEQILVLAPHEQLPPNPNAKRLLAQRRKRRAS